MEQRLTRCWPPVLQLFLCLGAELVVGVVEGAIVEDCKFVYSVARSLWIWSFKELDHRFLASPINLDI
jgi:hypothetical protein